MDEAKSILQTLIFVVPGFIAVEVTNGFTARQARMRSDFERLATALIFSAVIWSLYLLPFGLYGIFGQGGEFNLSAGLTPWAFLFIPLMSVAAGMIWGWFRNKRMDKIYSFLQSRTLTDYAGLETVWDFTLRTMQGRWVRVQMKDGRVFLGAIKHRSNDPQSPALFIESPSMGFEKYEKVGEKYELVTTEGKELGHSLAGVYIDAKEVDTIYFYLTDEEKPKL